MLLTAVQIQPNYLIGIVGLVFMGGLLLAAMVWAVRSSAEEESKNWVQNMRKNPFYITGEGSVLTKLMKLAERSNKMVDLDDVSEDDMRLLHLVSQIKLRNFVEKPTFSGTSDPVANLQKEESVTNSPKKIKKILYVEDDIANRALNTKLLIKAGYEVTQAEDGVDGVEKANSSAPDLILMDLQMPKLDGFGATKQIHDNPDLAKVPVVALTAHSDKKEECMSHGFSGFLVKPLDLEALSTQIGGFGRN